MKSESVLHKDNTEFNMLFFNGLADFEYINLRAFEEINVKTGNKTEVITKPGYKVMYVDSGAGTLHFGKETVNCTCGDVFIISKGIKYYIEANSISKINVMNVAFEFTKNIPHSFSLAFDTLGNKCVGKSEKVKTLMQILGNEYNNGKTFANEVCESIVKIILIDIWRKLIQNKEIEQEQKTSAIVKMVAEYIEHNVGRVAVSDINENFPYNGSYISHLFKQQLGMPLKEYIITVNMKRASELLKQGNKPLAEVAKECGYDSVPTFCRMLKKYTGTTSLKIKRAGKMQK